MVLAVTICICLTVIAVCCISCYAQTRESDFGEVRQDLALLRYDLDKLKKELDDFESCFDDEE